MLINKWKMQFGKTGGKAGIWPKTIIGTRALPQ